MPSNSTDTDSFPANVQRPNNGEPADAASLSQGFNPITQRSRYLYNRTRARIYDVTRAPYNADPTSAVDSSTAFQSALDAAESAGGGTVVVPGGFYRLNSGLDVPRSVDLEATSHAVLYLNHASDDFITFKLGASYTGGVARIRGFTFGGFTANSGTVIKDPVDTSPWRHLIEDCAFNFSGNALQGPIIEQLGATEMTLRNCYIASQNAAAAHVVRQAHASAYMSVLGCRLVAPNNATWAARLLEASGGRGTVSGCQFDLGPLLTVGGVALKIGAAGKPWRVIGNEFIAPTDGYSCQGITWSTLAQIVESGNIFSGAAMRAGAFPSANPGLNYGSRLDSLGHFQNTYGSVGSIVIPAGYRSVVLACSATTGPALTMPLGFHDGQELLLTYYNASGTTVSPSFASTPVTGTTIPTILAGNTLTGVFVWEDRSGAGFPDRWIQKGTWGVGLTLA